MKFTARSLRLLSSYSVAYEHQLRFIQIGMILIIFLLCWITIFTHRALVLTIDANWFKWSTHRDVPFRSIWWLVFLSALVFLSPVGFVPQGSGCHPPRQHTDCAPDRWMRAGPALVRDCRSLKPSSTPQGLFFVPTTPCSRSSPVWTIVHIRLL